MRIAVRPVIRIAVGTAVGIVGIAVRVLIGIKLLILGHQGTVGDAEHENACHCVAKQKGNDSNGNKLFARGGAFELYVCDDRYRNGDSGTGKRDHIFGSECALCEIRKSA